MPSPSPRPSTGTRPWPLPRSRPASMSTWKSPVAITPPRVRCSSPRSANTARWCRWARSSAPRRTPSRLSTRFTTASSAAPITATPGTAIRASLSASANPRRFPRSSTGTCGRAPRRANSIETTWSPTTGTGSAPGAPAKPSTTARTRWMSAAGRSASISPTPSMPLAAATTFTTTGSSTTRWSPTSPTPTNSSAGKGKAARA